MIWGYTRWLKWIVINDHDIDKSTVMFMYRMLYTADDIYFNTVLVMDSTPLFYVIALHITLYQQFTILLRQLSGITILHRHGIATSNVKFIPNTS